MKTQIELIQDAMKEAGLWSENVPDWINQYSDGRIDNIWQWLQFIHLPMRLNGEIKIMQYLAPQISEHLQSVPDHTELLQRIIELDSITSTLQKT